MNIPLAITRYQVQLVFALFCLQARQTASGLHRDQQRRAVTDLQLGDMRGGVARVFRMYQRAQAASLSASVPVGPESLPFAAGSRSTSSMIAIAALSP